MRIAKDTVLGIIIFTFLIGCKETEISTLNELYDAYSRRVSQIETLKYDARWRITFPSGTEWDKTGTAILQPIQSDTIFGFSFWGIRHDANESAIYKDGIGYHIINNDKQFIRENGGRHFLGRPGGNIVYGDYFKLDTIYKEAHFSSNDTAYVIDYKFEDIIEYGVTNRSKRVEISKDKLLPILIQSSRLPEVGERQTIKHEFHNLQVNTSDPDEINNYLINLREYEQITYGEPQPNKILNTKSPPFRLQNIENKDQFITLTDNKLTLLDFWEIWCGPCIKSLPEIQRIDSVYRDDLNTIGIVAKDIDRAAQLINKRQIEFTNVIGTNEVSDAFSVNSWPRYFLIDKDGIVVNEYHGYSDQIEKDILSRIK